MSADDGAPASARRSGEAAHRQMAEGWSDGSRRMARRGDGNAAGGSHLAAAGESLSPRRAGRLAQRRGSTLSPGFGVPGEVRGRSRDRLRTARGRRNADAGASQAAR